MAVAAAASLGFLDVFLSPIAARVEDDADTRQAAIAGLDL